MKLCPKCGIQYPDDANFCHLDAGRLVWAEVEQASDDAADAGATGAGAGADDHDPNLLDERFELGERFGGRQTGDVYEAVDRSTGAACMVKVVFEEVFPKSLLMQRTERELGKLIRLDNPGIARVLGYGHRDGRLWIATERVSDYRSLLDIVFDGGPIPSVRAAEIVVAVGKALSEAAKVGVIHRDLAPKNVLVRGDSSVKLINFGVAVPTTEKVHGVAEFVAPEIVEGRPVDQRANIYSLGALFYYLVTGRPPYMGDPEDVYEQHLSGEPEPPSVHVAEISDATDVVILRALARSSSKRFMTLRQLLNDVERIASGEEPLAASPAMAALAPRGKRKSRKLAQTMLGGHKIAAEAREQVGQGAGDGAALAATSVSGEAGGESAATSDAEVASGAAEAATGPVDGAEAVRAESPDPVDDSAAAAASAPGPERMDKAQSRRSDGARSLDGGAGASKVGLTIKEHYQDNRQDNRQDDRSERRQTNRSGKRTGAARGSEASDGRAGQLSARAQADDSMASEDLVREMKQGRGIAVAIIVTVLLLLAAVAAVYFLSDS